MSLLDKHRPTRFADLVFATPQLQSHLKAYADGRRGGSLLLHGPYGTGKSTIAEAIQRELLIAEGSPNVPYVMEAADWHINSLKMVTGHWSFEQMELWHPRVIINELDQLKQRQLNLRALYDKHSKHGYGFIFTTNHLDQIDPGLRSRCDVVHVPMPSPNAWVNRVMAVMSSEGASVTPQQALQLAQVGQASIREIGKAMDQLLASHRAALV